MALFGLSPLAVYYHRLVSLDNIGTLWLLAAMVAATSRRRSLGAAFWAGVFSAVAVLSKETIAILLPVVFWLIWQQSQPLTRKWHVASTRSRSRSSPPSTRCSRCCAMSCSPAAGTSRCCGRSGGSSSAGPAAGSCSAAGSAANGLLTLWLGTDRWLLLGGLTATLPGFFVRRLRPLALRFPAARRSWR